MDVAVEVKNLVKRYKKAEKNAVDGVSFSVAKGDFFAFLGPNGAGKTTTISILNTTLAKTSGSVQILGFDLDTHPEEVRRRIGVIFQKPSLDLNLTAEENIRLHASLYGLYPFRPFYGLMPQSYKKKVKQLADVLNINAELFHKAKTFSGGMKRKLEIVRSLLHEPQILFLDEPTSGLDPESRKNLWEYLREVRRDKKMTMFLTTHYLEEVEDADKVCIINHGKVISYGSPQMIKEKLTQEYIQVTTKDDKKLLTELKQKKIAYKQNGALHIDLKGHTLQSLLQKIRTPLTTIKVHTPTLEEAYLHIVENPDYENT